MSRESKDCMMSKTPDGHTTHRITSFIAQDRDRTIADFPEKSSDSAKGAAKSAAIDPELANLVANWPSLPAMIRAAILAVARQHLAKG